MKNMLRDTLRPLEGIGLLVALVLAVIVTAVVLIAPQHQWGPEMWPFYLGAAGVLVWVVVDLWAKLRAPPGTGDASANADDAGL